MIPQISDDGYLKITLRKNDESYKHSIHRLLALQYIPNLNNSPTVDHIDRNKTNNCLENLRWYTKKEQANNKTTNIVLLSEEEKVQRIEDNKEYKTKWARWNRLKTGESPLIPIPLKTEEEKEATYIEYKKSRLVENLIPEEIEKNRLRNKKSRENHIQTEEEKVAANARAKKQREDIKADPEKAAQAREYKRLKAIEYRAKKSNII